jgi:hypothetical protein
MRHRVYSREDLLASINHRLDLISQAQQRLSQDKLVLREQATRLRLGTAVDEVRFFLERADLLDQTTRHPKDAQGVSRDQ